jgi:hypothetical protein
MSPRSEASSPQDPARALDALAAQLREEGTVISGHVRESSAEPALGLLVAAGPRAVGAPAEYAVLVEAIREGYLLHYAESRLVRGADSDLKLLAGDYLYARGLERLAGLGDVEAVREFSDLISLCAQLHAEPAGAGAAPALWLGSLVAVAAGPSEDHERAKAMLREGVPGGAAALRGACHTRASEVGLGARLAVAAESIDSAAETPTRG